MAEKKYEDMTPEEREVYDKAEKAREEQEQAQLPYKYVDIASDRFRAKRYDLTCACCQKVEANVAGR